MGGYGCFVRPPSTEREKKKKTREKGRTGRSGEEATGSVWEGGNKKKADEKLEKRTEESKGIRKRK